MSTNYSKTVDKQLSVLWNSCFKEFEFETFKLTCQKIITTSDYFPKVNQVIAVYKQIKSDAEQEKFEKLKENHRLLTQSQNDCYLCNNTGFCNYTQNGYEFMARCICAHGKDLNKFSKAQIDKEYIPEVKQNSHSGKDIEKLKQGINPFYISTIKEALGKKYYIYEAEKKAQKLERTSLSEEEKLKILQGGFCNG